MKLFRCSCGQTLYFKNTACLTCGARVGFDPAALTMRCLSEAEDGLWAPSAAEEPRHRFRLCRNADHGVCNWLVRAEEEQAFCLSCRLNETIPNLSKPGNLQRWSALEAAKRQLVYGLLSLGLAVETPAGAGPSRLTFRFLEDQRTNPDVVDLHVLTGYAGGVITINVAEADDVHREITRLQMNEAYRTLVGHFRHESGHFYWQHLIDTGPWLGEFRALFGDETEDYAAALARYHDSKPPAGWSANYISGYAQSHPLEDWAECWAHYLHMVDTVETAATHGVVEDRGLADDFDAWLAQWTRLSVILNELNRSMGMPDAYPFVLAATVVEKLRLVHDVISDPGCSTGNEAAR